MKHTGSHDDLLTQRRPEGAVWLPRAAYGLREQGWASLLVCFACVLFLVAVVADPVVRDLARSLDPTAKHVLRWVTEFGNSAYSLVLGLLLLGWLAIAKRWGAHLPAEATRQFQSSLILFVGSIALSGFLASLSKNIIGRARPSFAPDVGVFDFSAFSLTPGLAAFPSGHATTATACAVVLAVLFRHYAWAWLSIGVTAALSRAFLGVHWLSDCLAGIALGGLVTLALHRWMAGRGHVLRMDASVPVALLRDSWGRSVRLVRARPKD